MIVTGQLSATSSAATLCTVPPGPCLVVLNSGGSSTGVAFVGVKPGSGEALKTTNGVPLNVGQTFTFATYAGSTGTTLQAICSSGKTATVGFLISTTD